MKIESKKVALRLMLLALLCQTSSQAMAQEEEHTEAEKQALQDLLDSMEAN